MPVAVGEAVHLVLDRGAVTRPDPADLAGEQRRAIEIGADDVVGARVGAGDRAEQLRVAARPASAATSSNRSSSDGCRSSARPVDRPAVEPRRRAGLQPGERQAEVAELVRQVGRGPLADPAAGRSCVMPKCSLPPRKVPVASTIAGAGKRLAARQRHAARRAPVEHKRRRLALDHLQAAAAPRPTLDRAPKQLAVGLDARAAHRRALARVEHPIVDRRLHRRATPIRPSKASTSRTRWPLPSPPIAGLQDIAPICAAIEADQRHLRAEPRGRRRGLDAGMAAANNDDIEIAHGGALVRWRPPRKLFHVEQLFSDAEAPEKQCRASSSTPGAAGDPVERQARHAQVLRRATRGSVAACASKRLNRVSQALRDGAALSATSPSEREKRVERLTSRRARSSRPCRCRTDTASSASIGAVARSAFGVDRGSHRPACLQATPATARCRRRRPNACARSTPIASISSPVSRRPAVSISTNGRPADARRRLDQIARRARRWRSRSPHLVPLIALKRLDFPAFGGPAMTTRTPSFEPLGRRPLEPGLQSRSAAPSRLGNPPAAARHRPRRRSPAPPRPAPRAPARVPPCLDLAAERAAGEGQRGAALRFGLRLEQIGQPLRLGEVDPAILEGAAGEFARRRLAQPRHRRQRAADRGDDRAAAMEMEFGDVLAGGACRTREDRGRARGRAVSPCQRKVLRLA